MGVFCFLKTIELRELDAENLLLLLGKRVPDAWREREREQDQKCTWSKEVFWVERSEVRPVSAVSS